MKTVLIKDSNNCFVREDGKIIGKSGAVLSQIVNKVNGYCYVSIKYGDKFISKRIHRLIAEALLPNPYNLPEVNHIDGDKENNLPSNLEWVSSSDNKRHAIEVLGKNVGVTHWNSSIDEETVHEICKLLSSGYNNVFIMEKLNISQDIVVKIRTRVSWTNISKDYLFPPKSRALSEETVSWVCKRFEDGLTIRQIFEIAENDKLTINVIKAIHERRNYKYISCNFNF